MGTFRLSGALPDPIFDQSPMMRNHRESGEGRVGLMVALIICGTLIFLGMKILPVRIAAYEFRDMLREQARFAAVRSSDSTVSEQILNKAAELDIPLSKKGLQIRRTVGEIIISVSYEQPIDLKVTTYTYRFNAVERAPLF